jgi:hypothetical protein
MAAGAWRQGHGGPPCSGEFVKKGVKGVTSVTSVTPKRENPHTLPESVRVLWGALVVSGRYAGKFFV